MVDYDTQIRALFKYVIGTAYVYGHFFWLWPWQAEEITWYLIHFRYFAGLLNVQKKQVFVTGQAKKHSETDRQTEWQTGE